MTLREITPRTVRPTPASAWTTFASALLILLAAPAAAGALQVLDRFGTSAFTNNDGAEDWAGAWIEDDTAGAGAGVGNVVITGGQLELDDQPNTGTQPSLAREVDLSGFGVATLRFDFATTAGVDTSDAVVIEASSNGGGSYTVLETFTGISGVSTGSRTYALDSFTAANTRIRFRVTNLYGGGNETFSVDNVEITAGAIISDFVWYDLDSDATPDAAEVGLRNVVVNLHSGLSCAGPVLATTTTDNAGSYSFEELAAGDYCVEVYEETLPATGFIVTTAGNPRTLTLAATDRRTDIDFGFTGTNCLPDIDFEEDAAGTPTTSGQVIDDEYAPFGITISVVANGGAGAFNEVMIFDGDNPSGGDDDLGSPNEGFGGPGVGGAGAPGGSNENRVPLGRVAIISEDGDSGDPDDNGSGGTITFLFDRDLDLDSTMGLLDNGDTVGVDGGEIRLYDSGGVQIGADIPIPGTGDNGAGSVSFAGNGVRRLEYELFGSGTLDTFDLCAERTRDGRIGDLVWHDLDDDAVLDIGEPGLPNVEVTLWDTNGTAGTGDDTVVATTVTDADGFYLFDGLPARTFYVDVTDADVPAGLSLSPPRTDPAPDVTLAAGATDLLSDFPYSNQTALAVIGDTVWSDADNDGLLDPGETGIGAVTVELIGPGPDGLLTTGDDVVVDTEVTTADGRYLFSGVAVGDYLVRVDETSAALTGYALTSGAHSNPNPTLPIFVDAGDAHVRADFGYFNAATFSIADQVWFDADGDGIRDAGESALAGVTVSLLDAGGDVIATTRTDSVGGFSFTGLPNGKYTLAITDVTGVLAGLTGTTTPGVDRRLNVDLAGADVSAVSFGYNGLARLGDRVWSDADGDTVQDAAEPGIAGVTVELFVDINGDSVLNGADNLIDTAVTGADGDYLFTDLLPLTYFVSIDPAQAPLSGYTRTTADDQAAAEDQLTSSLAAVGDSDLSRDFGYRNNALPDVSGNVFEDTDRDGVDDGAGDPGIAGVTLDLVDPGIDGLFGTPDDTVVATATTDGAGDYSFPDVPAGSYRVEVTDTTGVLADYFLTSGLDEIEITVAAVDITDIDFGYGREFDDGTIGDFVWHDADRDGIQDGAESGLGDVDLVLYLDNGDGVFGAGDTAVGNATTDLNGLYLFTGLAAASYFVDVVDATVPATLVLTTGSSDPSTLINLTQGEDYRDADFGYSSPAGTSAIGDFVWYDANSDGVQDPGEVGIPGVTVDITGPGCAPCTAVTDGAGGYLVTGLASGDFDVTVDTSTLPAGYNTAPTNIGSTTLEVMLFGNYDALFADWGFDGGTVGSIGDFVWLDSDGDGAQDAGEGGLEGVTLDLIDVGSGDVIASTITDMDGGYDFVGLPAGTYRVDVTDNGGVLIDLNLSGGSDPTAPIVLAAGGDVDTADFGYAPSAGIGTIGNFVWRDLDNSGDVDPGEAGIQGVTLDLWVDVDNNGMITVGTDNFLRTVTTDVNGEYEFNSLPPENYLVTVTDEAGVLTGFVKTSGTAGVDNNSQADPYSVTVTSPSPNNLTADFGYFAPADLSISGITFFDLGGDGSVTPVDDFGVNEVTVLLFRDLDGDGVLDPEDPVIDAQLSNGTGPGLDEFGEYLFTNLPPGDFIVAVDATGTFLDGNLQTTQLATSSVQPVTLVATDSTDNDFGFTQPATAVLVASLDARVDDGRVVVTWRTAAEVGSAGFWLERWDSRRERWQPVHHTLVPALDGAPQGGSYELVDAAADPAAARLDYRLVEVQRRGPERVYGPYPTKLAGDGVTKDRGLGADTLASDGWRATPHPPTARDDARRAAYRALVAAATPAKGDGPGGGISTGPAPAAGRLAIEVETTGLVEVDVRAAASVLGLPSGQLSGAIARGNVRLSHRGAPVSWLASPRGLIFFGEAIDSPFTTRNVYWLELGAGQPMTQSGGAQPAPAPGLSFRDRPRFEVDAFAATFVTRDPESDYWPWAGLIAGHPTFGSRDFVVDLVDLDTADGADAQLTVELLGAGDGPVADEHHAEILVDGVPVGEIVFDGFERRIETFPVAAALLQESENTITVRALLGAGVASSFFYVEGFDLEHARRYVARDGALLAGAGGHPVVTVEGFAGADILVFDITEPLRPTLLGGVLVDSDKAGFRATFRPPAGSRFAAVERAALAAPAGLRAGRDSDLMSPRRRADYVVIAPPELLSGVGPLLDYREATGFTVELVDLQVIVDELADGIYHPRAVADFLAVAWSTWSLPPSHAVLVGAGHLDYRDLQGLGANPMPPLMVGTPYGLYAADGALGNVAGDVRPEIAVGRLPVLTPAEIAAYVEKLRAYESGAGSWTRRALLLADNGDMGGDFAAGSYAVGELLDKRYELASISLDELSLAEAREKLFADLTAGVGFVNFVGHGGLDRLAAEGLLTVADVAGLGNAGRTPLVASLTCNVGRFEIPGLASLGEELVLQEAGGAVAVFAPTGLSLDFEAAGLDQAFASAVLLDDTVTLGEGIRATLGAYLDEGGRYDFMVEIYNLLGDPAITPVRP